ncbi:TrbI/VirB10 family protein [Pantoea sp. CFSAN033090]|uniref:TrbI/VirB10 family protein n=1 Tax=Pantoea sp. CFSAN033090 TaxID=1690502 RepID=UPI00069022D4|nr:TrbI/VirB10 family protein [Pantoea sp. CFSAN033090]
MSEENKNDQLSEEDVARQFDVSSNRKSKKKTSNIIFTVMIVLFMLCVIGGIFWVAMSAIQGDKKNSSDSTATADPALTPVSEDNQVSRYQEQLEARKKEAERLRQAREDREKQEKQAKQDDTKAVDDPFASYSEDDKQATASQGGEQPLTPQQRKMKPGVMVDPKGASFGSSGSSGSSAPASQTTSAGGSNNSGEDDGLDDIRATANGQGAAQIPALGSGSGAGAGDNDNGGSSGSGQTYLESHMRNSKFSPGKAYKMPNRDFLLSRGTNLRCTTKEEIISEYPAPVDCTVTKDIYSDNRKNLLIRQGDVISGEMNVQLTQGKGKVFSSFTLLRGARGDDGIQADFASLAVGPMGSAGIDAYVDNHWGARFGNSIMLAFIQDVFASARNSTQKSSDYQVNNSEGNANDMANKALENSINIPPTGYVLPAKTINVYVMRDIDFSSVYKVHKVQNTNINFDDCGCTK